MVPGAQTFLDAGTTDIQAYVVPVGEDRRTTRQRSMDLPASLTG